MKLRRPVLVRAVGAGLGVGVVGLVFGATPFLAVKAAWCAFVATHAWLIYRHLWAAGPETMRERAKTLTEGRRTVFALSLLAAVAALGTVGWEAASATSEGWGKLLSVVTILMSWSFVHLLFAQEYAHEYWLEEQGLNFEGGAGAPEFSDFLYVAVTVGATSQVSDTDTDSPEMRRLVMIHTLVSFLFNVVILGAAVNVAAGLAR